MVSPKTQFTKIFEGTQYTNNDKLEVLNSLIEKSQSIHDQLKYYAERALVNFDMSKWCEALADVNFVENYQDLTDSLMQIKGKATVHCEMGKIRDWFKCKLGLKLIDNNEHMDFLRSISEESIDNLIGKKKKRRSTLKRLQK